MGRGPRGAVGRDHHLLPIALLILVPLLTVALGRGGVVATVSTTKVTGGLDLATEVGLDGLLAGGVLGGDVLELPRCAWGLAAERVDECLSGRAADEGIGHVGVGDVGEFIALLGEALHVVPKGLVSPLPAVAEVP
jgi:hypothetical protein